MSKNDFILKYVGLDKWHSEGYIGETALCATGERCIPKGKMKDFAYNPFVDEEGDDHAYKTAMVFHAFAPGAKLYMVYPDDRHEGNFTKKTFPWLKENNITNIFVSLRCESLSGIDEQLETLPYLKYWSSAGNYSEDSYNKRIESTNIFGVGSFNVKNESPSGYSSTSEYVDFSFPGDVYFEATNGNEFLVSGTSYAAPALCGACACIDDLFIQKTGKPLSRNAMYQFLKDCSVDIGNDGKDSKTGWGLPILPHPNDVDISKYSEDIEMATFKDIEGHWAEKYIEEAVEDGIINGFQDGTFRPDEALTRAQFAKLYHEIKNKVK